MLRTRFPLGISSKEKSISILIYRKLKIKFIFIRGTSVERMVRNVIG